jgi:hypothetical protein
MTNPHQADLLEGNQYENETFTEREIQEKGER